MEFRALLADNSEAFELAIAEAMADELPVPVRQILDPATTPSAFIPFLAAHRSADLWFEDWPEDRKRQMVAEAPFLARLVGTQAAAEAFLAYVDAEIIHKVSHPARFPVGRIAVGRRTPVHHKPFVARFLVRVSLTAPAHATIVGRTAVGRAAIRTINREPLRRAKTALSLSKAPETAYTVSFSHRVRRTLDDGLSLDAGLVLGSFKDRHTL